MLFTDEYYVAESPSNSLFKDRGSRFIGHVIPVESENQVKKELENLRKQYFDATHVCYAFILGADKSAWRMNDDGEPSGTAGRPIYGQILSADLTNILVAVVRYYGGTKLGVSGLINAYKITAQEAIAGAGKVKRLVKEVFEVDFEYENMDKVMRTLKEDGAELLKNDFGMKCVIEFAVSRMESNRVNSKLERIKDVNIKHLMTI